MTLKTLLVINYKSSLLSFILASFSPSAHTLSDRIFLSAKGGDGGRGGSDVHACGGVDWLRQRTGGDGGHGGNGAPVSNRCWIAWLVAY